jgi:hypothetical protein
MDQWPTNLNYTLDRGSFSIEEKEPARTDFDDGPQLVRVRFNNPLLTYSGTLTMTNDEFMVFRSFYFGTLNQGSRWFELPVWEGNSYTVRKARFAEKYSVKDEGWNQYTVTIKLDVRNYFYYNTFSTYFISIYGADFAIELADKLQIIVNQTYPTIMADYL